MNIMDIRRFATIYSRDGSGKSYAIGTLYGSDITIDDVAIDWRHEKTKCRIALKIKSIHPLKSDGPLYQYARYYAE
jgi:hypothetical protein